MAIASINPATGEKVQEFSAFDDAEMEKRLARAEKAFSKYRRTTFTDRSVLLEVAAELLFQEKKKFAEIITLEMGKLFRDSVAEIEKCARGCRFTPRTASDFSKMRRRKPMPLKVMLSTNRLDRCSPSCRGIFLFGRYFDLLRPR